MDVVGVKPGMVIGEVGAGHGYFTFHLSRRVGDSGKIYANDIATRALASIRRKCEGDLTQEEVLEHIKNSDFDLDRIETFLPQHNIYIINTHSHGDHAGGNKTCGGNAVGPRVKKYLKILDWIIDEFPQGTKFIGGHGRDYSMTKVKDYRKMLADTIKIV